MKKLYLTSFTFTTGTEEVHKEDRIVMVTSKEVEAFKATSTIDYEYDAELYAAQEKAENWFKANFTQSEMLSIISHPTITGYLEEVLINSQSLTQNNILDDTALLGGFVSYGINEFPPRDPNNEDVSRDVLIDLDGDRKRFCVGYYSFPFDELGGEWIVYTDDEVTEHMKWMDILPLASKDN